MNHYAFLLERGEKFIVQLFGDFAVRFNGNESRGTAEQLINRFQFNFLAPRIQFRNLIDEFILVEFLFNVFSPVFDCVGIVGQQDFVILFRFLLITISFLSLIMVYQCNNYKNKNSD